MNELLGWWTISGETLLDVLRRSHQGEDPDVLYMELYVNSEREQVPGTEVEDD